MKHINKKYLYIGIGVAVLIILIILSLFLIFHKKVLSYKTFTASDGSFQIMLPNNITYQNNIKENQQFIMDLYSEKDDLFLYATKIQKSHEVDLSQIVEDDKKLHLATKKNIREDSGIVSSMLQNYPVKEYHFVYNDTSYGKDFYSNIIWIETNTNLYILNFEVANENMEKYQGIFLNIKNSFVEL